MIVFLILLTCSGIFTVFIGKVREAGARTQCRNNCQLIGIAMTTYQEINNGYPSAAMPNARLPEEQRLSWLVVLNPYVEASKLYARMDKEKSWDADENRFAAEMRLAFLICPGCPMQQSDGSLAPTHYVGISDVGANAIVLSRDDRHAGIFGYDRPVKLQELKRGAGETILVVETSHIQGAWTAAGAPTTRGFDPGNPPYCGRSGQFGGNHRQGANVVFADGSVRLIERSVAPPVWEAMATLRGDENPE